jgi:chromosomal replication initiator protein
MLDELWQTTLAELELLISKANFTTWFKNTYISQYDNNIVIVATPNAFTKAWLEKKYHPQILKALNNITNNDIKKVEYIVEARVSQKNQVNTSQKPKIDAVQARQDTSVATSTVNAFGLSSKYVFSSFIVGAGNELAHAASKAISEKPGKLYNPLFIYGGVGLGKTHLAQAVGNAILENNPKAKILYINSEKFTNDFVQAIKTGNIDQFKRDYRNVDALIIDDIQFIAGKEQTQEEFFHTFNALHQNDKQIVITSDRPPKAIPDIEARLISRFEWGMIVDITMPDFETRMAILQTKCQEKGMVLPMEVIEFLAENIQNNIRELEGALNRIIAHQQLTNVSPTLDFIKNMVQTFVTSAPQPTVTTKKVIQIVANHFDINISDLIGACRRKELVVPRQITMFLLREEIKCSFPTIGQEMGGKDHTTAMHAVNKISKILDKDDKLKNHVNVIKQKLYSYQGS